MRLYDQLVEPGAQETSRRRRHGRGLSVWRPLTWPRTWRRAALLTLPLAIAVWLVVAILSVFHLAFQDARKPLKRFWNAPARRSSYGYFHY